jgi:hypothetical protein
VAGLLERSTPTRGDHASYWLFSFFPNDIFPNTPTPLDPKSEMYVSTKLGGRAGTRDGDISRGYPNSAERSLNSWNR